MSTVLYAGLFMLNPFGVWGYDIVFIDRIAYGAIHVEPLTGFGFGCIIYPRHILNGVKRVLPPTNFGGNEFGTKRNPKWG